MAICAVSWIENPVLTWPTLTAGRYSISEEAVQGLQTSSMFPCSFLYAVPLLLIPLIQGISSHLFLGASFILIASSLVSHPCFLHKVFKGWFFVTLLSNWEEKKNPQFNTISGFVLFVVLKKARIMLVWTTPQVHFVFNFITREKEEVILNINWTRKESRLQTL